MGKDFSRDDDFSRRFSASEMAAMRRLAADQDDLGRRLFALIRRAAAKLPFAEDILAAWHCLRDPATPRRTRFILMSAVAYFVLPIDAVPDLMPFLGFTDDAAVAGAVKPEHREKAKETLASL